MEQEQSMHWIAGCDEAGRGPLAGPVVAAVVVLDPLKPIKGLKDSKLLLPKQREHLAQLIEANALAWATGRAEVEEIDRINILQATFLAMQRAVAALKLKPHLILVDGNQAPKLSFPVKTIINGDQLEPAISAASILAKVTRDREMVLLDQLYPHYGFAKHKGYATAEHFSALAKYGACPLHRKSFAPVAEVL